MGEKINREKLVQFLSNIDQEVLNMMSGEGKHRPGLLHIEVGKNSCPTLNRLEVLRNEPTKENLDIFLALSIQDFGAATGAYFEGMSRNIFKIPVTAANMAVKKAFDVAIKDSFYDMFRTARISMEPKQVEQIEAHSLKLAGIIQTEIHKQTAEAVKSQLGALVATMQEKEKAQAQADAEASKQAWKKLAEQQAKTNLAEREAREKQQVEAAKERAREAQLERARQERLELERAEARAAVEKITDPDVRERVGLPDVSLGVVPNPVELTEDKD